MGCGASVPVADTRSRRRPWFSFMTKSSYEVRSCRPGAAHPRRARTPTARARADAQADRSLVTPPTSNVPTSEAMPTAPHGLQVLTGSGDCSALRILAPSCKQPEAGVAGMQHNLGTLKRGLEGKRREEYLRNDRAIHPP